MQNDLLNVTKKVSLVLVAKITTYILGFILHIIITRMMGDVVFGEYLLIYSIIMISGILCLAGYKTGLLYDLPRLINDQKQTELASFVSSTFMMSLALSTIVCIVINWFAEPINGWFLADQTP